MEFENISRKSEQSTRKLRAINNRAKYLSWICICQAQWSMLSLSLWDWLFIMLIQVRFEQASNLKYPNLVALKQFLIQPPRRLVSKGPSFSLAIYFIGTRLICTKKSCRFSKKAIQGGLAPHRDRYMGLPCIQIPSDNAFELGLQKKGIPVMRRYCYMGPLIISKYFE